MPLPEGFLNILKPAGMTSQGVVSRVRRLIGQTRVGHAGTLDPDATGVLPLAIGSYTRLLEFAQLTPKVYRGDLVLGELRHTGDASGRVIGESGPPWPLRAQLESRIPWLTGTVLQIPPNVSALKQQGQRLYNQVRAGRTVWPAARCVDVIDVRILGGEDRRWQFEAEVGSGTYIRALARDWGYLTGQAAYLDRLHRVRVGTFGEETAISLEELERLGQTWVDRLVQWTEALKIPIIEVDEKAAVRIRHGQRDVLDALAPDPSPALGLTYRASLLAIVEGPPWRYRKVLEKDESNAHYSE